MLIIIGTLASVWLTLVEADRPIVWTREQGTNQATASADEPRLGMTDDSIPPLPVSPTVPLPPPDVPPGPKPEVPLPPLVLPPSVSPASAELPKLPAVPPPQPPMANPPPPTTPLPPIPQSDGFPKLPPSPPPAGVPTPAKEITPATPKPPLPPSTGPEVEPKMPMAQPRHEGPRPIDTGFQSPEASHQKPVPASSGIGQAQYVVLKNGRLIAGQVRVEGETVVVREGALERRWPQGEIVGIAADAETVRQIRRQQVRDDDLAGRLELARWLMFQGLREQALAEARSILEKDPSQRQARELVRSLEQSLQQFPPAGKTPSPATSGRLLTDWAKELDLTTEGILTFASRAQPVLVNQCMDCHARPDYQGQFRLLRVRGLEIGGHQAWHNLRAVATQLRRDAPEQSPLLTYALRAHGGMKQPAFLSRQAPGYKALETWVRSAVLPPAPSMIPPARTEEAPPPPVIPPARAHSDAQPASLPASPIASPMREGPAPATPPPAALPPPLPPLPSTGQSLPPASGPAVPVPVSPLPPVPPPPAADEFDPAPFNQSMTKTRR